MKQSIKLNLLALALGTLVLSNNAGAIQLPLKLQTIEEYLRTPNQNNVINVLDFGSSSPSSELLEQVSEQTTNKFIFIPFILTDANYNSVKTYLSHATNSSVGTELDITKISAKKSKDLAAAINPAIQSISVKSKRMITPEEALAWANMGTKRQAFIYQFPMPQATEQAFLQTLAHSTNLRFLGTTILSGPIFSNLMPMPTSLRVLYGDHLIDAGNLNKASHVMLVTDAPVKKFQLAMARHDLVGVFDTKKNQGIADNVITASFMYDTFYKPSTYNSVFLTDAGIATRIIKDKNSLVLNSALYPVLTENNGTYALAPSYHLPLNLLTQNQYWGLQLDVPFDDASTKQIFNDFSQHHYNQQVREIAINTDVANNPNINLANWANHFSHLQLIAINNDITPTVIKTEKPAANALNTTGLNNILAFATSARGYAFYTAFNAATAESMRQLYIKQANLTDLTVTVASLDDATNLQNFLSQPPSNLKRIVIAMPGSALANDGIKAAILKTMSTTAKAYPNIHFFIRPFALNGNSNNLAQTAYVRFAHEASAIHFSYPVNIVVSDITAIHPEQLVRLAKSSAQLSMNKNTWLHWSIETQKQLLKANIIVFDADTQKIVSNVPSQHKLIILDNGKQKEIPYTEDNNFVPVQEFNELLQQ